MQNLILNDFGFPLINRKEEIAKKVPESNLMYQMPIMGRNEYLPIIRVRIQFPVYRLANGRTKSAQKEYLATHKDAPRDLFTNDHDSYDAQVVQHELLTSLAKEEGLLSAFKEEGLQQTEPILCTNTGVVVNGNRRLCAWRNLYYQDQDRYKHFEIIDVAILPELDDTAIYDLEKKLQIQKTMRAEYHWHTKALMAEEEILRGAEPGKVAKSYDLKKKELMILINARKIAAQYLQLHKWTDEWSRVDKARYAFESIVTGEDKILDQNSRELFRKYAFDLIAGVDNFDENPGGRLYQSIKDYANYITAIAEKQSQKLQKEAASSQKTETAQRPEERDDFSLLTCGDDVQQDDASLISTAIEKGEMEISHRELQQIVETQKALQNEKLRSALLVDQLSKISASLQSVIDNNLIEGVSTDGVKDQIEAIEGKIQRILKWVNEQQ